MKTLKKVAMWCVLALLLGLTVSIVGFVFARWRVDLVELVELDNEVSWVDHHTGALALWRLALIGVLVSGWPWLVAHYARWRGVSDEAIAELRTSRWHAAIVLLLIELVLIQASRYLANLGTVGNLG